MVTKYETCLRKEVYKKIMIHFTAMMVKSKKKNMMRGDEEVENYSDDKDEGGLRMMKVI